MDLLFIYSELLLFKKRNRRKTLIYRKTREPIHIQQGNSKLQNNRD